MTIKPSIEQSCPENWDKMRVGLHSRFCENCQKDVVDFTKMERKEILAYLFSNHDKQICGRLYKSQLDFTHADILVTIQALTQKHKNTNLSFYLLAVSTLLLAGCNQSDVKNTESPAKTRFFLSEIIGRIKDDTTETNSLIRPTDSVQSGNQEEIISIEDIPMLGEIAVFPDTIQGDGPYHFVEKMPEYAGGLDSLMRYIQKNLKYPEWERSNKIEGTIFVSFVVDKSGKVKDPKILKSIPEAQNFDKEVLRVVNNMPAWIPGEEKGEKVDVQFTLPVRFRL